jgi:hypothetical protein
MDLIALDLESPLLPEQIAALIETLGELERDHARAQTAVRRIAESTGGAVKVTPLKLEHLRLVEGTATAARAAGEKPPDPASAWRELFARSTGGAAPSAAAAALARSFESALGSSPSPAQWGTMFQGWTKQLSQVGPGATSVPADGLAPQVDGNAPGQAGQSPGDTVADADQPRSPASPGIAAFVELQEAVRANPSSADQLNAATSFLEALSPHLCQRLLADTMTAGLVPEPIVLALAQRLPPAIVLGALSAVARDNGQPSQAALAILRKVSREAGEDQVARNAPRTNHELAETATSLERLLQSSRESAFVPDEYLRRRQELSRAALPRDETTPLAPPDERDTTRHAADVVFQMLASPDADAPHVAAALEFLRHRLGPWVRAGNFEAAAEGTALARALCGHADETVAAVARSIALARPDFDDLVQGARRCPDRRTAAVALAELLHQIDGAALASLLTSEKFKASAPGDHVVLDSLRHVLTAAPEHSLRGLFASLGESLPAPLVAAFSKLAPADAVKAVSLALPHASAPIRRALLEQVFKRNISWPLELTERLLKDEDFDVRRLALMRLVRDSDPATAARHLECAARSRDYPIDVAVGLIELLRPHRRNGNPDVRRAFRRWFWSARRWGALFSLSVGSGGNRRRAG